MGICINYRGRLRDVAELPQLTAELQAAAARLNWPCRLVDERILGVAQRVNLAASETEGAVTTNTVQVYDVPVDDHVRGVMIQPPDCETLTLTFGRDGTMIHYSDARLGEPGPGRYGLIHDYLWVKTQFSNPRVHIQVCELLRLMEPYAAELEVHDDAGYWESGDEKVLLIEWLRSLALFAIFSDPKVAQGLLKQIGIEGTVEGPPEIGKSLPSVQPIWQKGWGVSAGDN
jgi:hypothetical protein